MVDDNYVNSYLILLPEQKHTSEEYTTQHNTGSFSFDSLFYNRNNKIKINVKNFYFIFVEHNEGTERHFPVIEHRFWVQKFG